MSYQIRSDSFPARTQHLTIHRIETELTKLQTWQHDHSILPSSTMAESIIFSLSRLEELHDCMDDILAVPSTRRALSNGQNSFLDSLLEASLKLLDVCSSSRDAMLVIKEKVQVLETIMRRRSADSNELDTIISNYTCLRKRMKKEVKKNLSLLKQIEQDLEGSMPSHRGQQLMSFIRGVKDVILTNASIFESLLMFISTQKSNKSKISSAKTKWLLTSRSKTTSDNISANELSQLDAELCNAASSVEVSSKIQTVNIIVDGIESSLERVFRRLIKTRATFLNIRSY